MADLKLLAGVGAVVASLSVSANAGTLDDVKSAGVVNCGVAPDRPGFAVIDAQKNWTGFDIDYCRAVASAVLGDPARIKIFPMTGQEQVVALQSGMIDLLPRALWTMSSDSSTGLMFAAATYFDAEEISGLQVRQGDDAWFTVVKWVHFAMVDAEARGAVSTDASLARGLGLGPDWAQDVIKHVGNYGEVFARNFKSARGKNALSANGGMIFAPPMR